MPMKSYLAFENAFRGSREQVMRELAAYLPLLAGRAPVLDVGCGRGELLELARDASLEARGIDTSDEMLEICREKKLEVVKADALTHLRSLPEGSLGAVVSFHLVEHLEPPEIPTFVSLAFRALRQGGVFLAETLNPGCLFSFAPFFMDPTHRFPVHPEVLKFYLHEAGFRDVTFTYREYFPPELLRLREPAPSGPAATPLEECCIENFRKLQLLLDTAFSHFIYAAAAEKGAAS